jgi:hypothetical protein
VSVKLSANTDPWTGPIKLSQGCIDLYSNIHSAGAEVDLWDCNGTAAQQLTFGASSSLRLGPANSAWCLGAHAGHTSPGTRIELYPCDGSPGQVFRWGSANRIVNPAAGLCVQPLHGSSAIGTVLVLARCSTAEFQRWDASGLVAHRGEMSSGLGAAYQLCLTDPRAATQPGTPLAIDPCRTTRGQIVTHRKNQLRIANQCLTAGAAQHVRSSTISLMPCAGAATQVFTAVSNGRLRNPATNTCLDVHGGHSVPATRVDLVACALTAAQRWRLPG